ncbi:MAG: helix-turn-helix domain-containing protein [Caulobacterales bacterium]|nr:helix-turn-helix domain-containing protein [Caulobacterales bacterium]MCA0372180.1 helix-turn-helix domain-containing protein [Pseudomonadota bacterium]
MQNTALLTTKQIAEMFNLSKATLDTIRSRDASQGPAYYKISHSIRYRPCDVEEWLEKNRFETNSKKVNN